MARCDHGVLWNAARTLFHRPESSLFNLPSLLRGFRFSLEAMWAEVSALNLLQLVPTWRCRCSSSSAAAITGCRRR